MRRSLVALAFAAISVSQVWAVFGISTGPGSSDSTFQWVGQVNGSSGVLIDPHWVLTAGHVGGNQFVLNGTTYTADATFNHPTADLHLMHFTNTFGGFYQLYNGTTAGQIATMVGWGNSATPRTDNKGYTEVTSAGVRRVATNEIGFSTPVTVGGFTTVILAADLDSANPNTPATYNRDWFGDGGATANEGGILTNDSGGAWLIDVGGGNFQLAGISLYELIDSAAATSLGEANAVAAYGISGSGAADLMDPVNRNWIVSTVPEPASTAAIAIGIAGLIARRRKKS